MAYTSVNGTFTYTITNTSSYVFDSTDYAIIQSAFDRWDNIMTLDSRLDAGYTITINYSVEVLEAGILGGASIQTFGYIGTLTFGNTFPYEADITLNATYLSGMKNAVRSDGKTSYYYVLLHEIGHILGIGSFWNLSGTPKVSYLDNGVTKSYYTGANALREYKSYFSAMGSSSFVGVPIEDNGGAGTVNVHPEEGPEGGVSADNRYINGILHPGLDTELMTGWLDGAPVSTPLSRITLGFLQDMGYTVNYNLADIYTMAAGSGTSSIDWASPTETILRASNLESEDRFGGSVAISGNFAIVGATGEAGASNGTAYSGAAYIFERNADTGIWSEKQILRASNLGAGDRFGAFVAISGNYAIVGANYEDGTSISATTDNCGAAYIFERDTITGNWEEKQILRASNLGTNDQFGTSLAISGNYVIVGAHAEDGTSISATANSGAAYIFERDGSGNWAEKQMLRASNLEAGDQFGISVAIDGNYAIVGAVNEDGSSTSTSFNSGAAYIFERNADTGIWSEKTILRASNLGTGDRFGQSVAIRGNYAIVGAAAEDGTSISATTDDCGAAYIFERDDSEVWNEKTLLRASNLGATDNFGNSVAIEGNYAIVGAPYEDGSSTDTDFNCGAAYIFERNSSGNWTETKILRASNFGGNDSFSIRVAISGNGIIVGAFGEGGASDQFTNSGAVYIYTGVIPPPSITITATASGSTIASGSIAKNTPIVLTFTSSASTTDFAVGDISVTNGSLTNFAASSATVYTATFTPNGQGPVVCTINVPANVFTSGSQNNTASTPFTFTFDAAPSMTITSTNVANNATTNVQPIELTFTSSEAITGFDAVDISFNRGSLTNFAGIGTVYTATFTQAGEGAYTINVPVGAYIDASGNANTAASTFTFNFDAPPSMTITSTTVTSGSTTNVKPIELTFTASKAITGFQVDDISFNSGTLSDLTVSSATVYTATFTPTIQGAYTINVPVSAYIDASGNSNTAASTFTFNFDAAPTMAITSTTLASGSTTNIASIPLTFTASEAITGFAVEDISFNKGTLGDLSGTGTVYTATFTQGGQGAHTINVPVGVYIDASGNANTAASSFNWTYDSVQPNMDISSTTFGVTSGSTTNNETIALTFTSSKPTNNFIKEDISFNRGSLAGFDGSGTVYTATFTQGGQGAHTIYVPVDAYADAVGNNNTASNIFTWSYDSISPSMDISSTTLGVTRGSTTKTTPIELRFTSSEATNNFALEDISFNNGTLTNFASVSPTVYTARFTPTSPGPVACTIDVLAGAYTDAATNLNNLATQFAFTFDSVVPTMTITSTTAGVVSGSTIDNATIALTFTSSKATNNFVVGDISVTNGTLSTFASSSPTVYTATFTATRQGLCTIGVASSVYTDAAGNNNAAANTFSVSYIPKFAEFNDANNLEQTYIAGFLDVSGTINHRAGDLNVMDGNVIVSSGNVSLNNGNLYVGGNGVLNSNLNVAGATTLGRVSVSNNMDVSGATNLLGALAISGLTSFNDNVAVTGNKTFSVGTGATIMGGTATLNSTLAVAGAVSMNSGLRVAGATTLTNAIMGGPVSVSERVVFLNDISFTGPNIDICGNLRAQYPANSIPAAAIIGGISVVNLFDTDVSLSQTLSVGGATSLSTLTATGNATLRSTVGIVGATTMSALTTSGATTFGGTLSVVGKAALTNDVSFNGSRIDICGNLYANYPANSIPLSAVVGGGVNPIFMTDVSINAILSVAGATTLQSTLVVSGQTTLANDVSFNGSRIDICGNLYANYPVNSIRSAAIIGGTTVSSTFNTDVSMNSRLYVKDSIKIGNLATISKIVSVSQYGGVFTGTGAYGQSVSISEDGSILAIGASTAGFGQTMVYQKDTTNTTVAPIGWIQLGDTIIGEASGDGAGRSVSVSSDGTNIIVAILAYLADGINGGDTGHVRVYQYEKNKAADTNQNNSTFGPLGWKRLGADIDGEAPNDNQLGSGQVSLSVIWPKVFVAIGAPMNDGTNSTQTSHGSVRVYQYEENKAANANQDSNLFGPLGWKRLGKDIDGIISTNTAGISVSLSKDGSLVAIGSPNNALVVPYHRGVVRVYQYQLGSNSWTQYGADIVGQAAGDQFGMALSLSADGTILAVCANKNDSAGSESGSVYVYRYSAGTWSQLGSTITGEATLDQDIDYAKNVSVYGNWPNVTVAIGAQKNDGSVTNSNCGHVRIYRYIASTWTKLGDDIDGTTASDEFGKTVSLSSDGSTLAIGTQNGNYVKVYAISNNPSTSVLSTSGLQTAGAATISGPLAVTGATTLSSTMNVSGAAIMNALNITGATTLAAMTVSGNATIDGTMLVTGTSSIGVSTMNSTLSVAAATVLSTKLVANGDVSLNNKLTVGAATTMNSTLTVAGATTLNNTAFMTSLATAGAVTLASTLYLAKSVTMNGDLDAAGVLLMSAVTMPSTLTVAGAATLSSQLSVAGATTMRSTLNTSGAVTIGGILSVAGLTTMTGTSAMNGKVSVGSDVTMNSTLIAINNATLASTLAVVGASTLSSTLYTSGSTTINNTLNVNGKTTFLNDISFNNNVTTPNTLTVNNNRITVGSSNIQYNAGISVDSAVVPASMYTTNNATVGGVLTVVGSTVLLSSLGVGGATTAGTMYASSNATLGSTLSVAGAATVGPLTVSGATTVSTLTTTGATTVGGTLGIAGASTMATLNVYGPMRQW